MLSPEEEIILEEVRTEYRNILIKPGVSRLYTDEEKEKITKGIHYIYALDNRPAPIVVFSTSPKNANDICNELDMEAWINEGKFPKGTPVDYTKIHAIGSYGTIQDYGWIQYYDFYQRIGHQQDVEFNTYKDMMKIGIYNMYQFESHCVVVPLPTDWSLNHLHQPHNDSGPFIRWDDGSEMYAFNNVPNLPRHWIMEKDKITKEEIRALDNLERRRVLMDIIGAEMFFNILLGECEVVDEDLDAYGKPMKLLKSIDKDPAINDFVYILSVVDTSTDRKYEIFPNVRDFPEARTNVFAAKASTFGKKKEEFRVIEES